jgi:hypothetical protein
LENFCRGTGQLINPEKCSIFFNDRCAEDIRDQIASILGTNLISFESKYLGSPTTDGRMKSERFQPINDRLSKRLSHYTERELSIGAKEILIRAVGQAIPVYIMSVFKL